MVDNSKKDMKKVKFVVILKTLTQRQTLNVMAESALQRSNLVKRSRLNASQDTSTQVIQGLKVILFHRSGTGWGLWWDSFEDKLGSERNRWLWRLQQKRLHYGKLTGREILTWDELSHARTKAFPDQYFEFPPCCHNYSFEWVAHKWRCLSTKAANSVSFYETNTASVPAFSLQMA